MIVPGSVRLVVMDGPDKGLSIDLKEGTVVIGTNEECTLRLTDARVSRKHLQLELQGAKVRATDLGSKNGTRYLGANIERVDLPLGASVELGHTVLCVFPVAKSTDSARESLGEILGRSIAMQELFSLIEQVAPTDTACVIQGETGTGKDLVSRTIHAFSERAKGPFVTVECGSLNASLASATLFGHVRGAFTGAVKDSDGLVGAADGGTLYLDDVGALPLDLQPLLLRVLDTHSFERVGEGQLRTSNFRVLASSREELETTVKEGRLRSDLYYRLATITLRIPPLRQRVDDLVLLAQHFVRKAKPEASLSDTMLAGLAGWRWPGNVRELKNAVERWVALGEWAQQTPKPEGEAFHHARDKVIASFERNYLVSLLEKHKGSMAAVAREAGIARSFVYRLLDNHGLSPDDYR